MIFTGSKDTDTIILNKLNDKDLFNISLTCKHFKEIISDDLFWLKRITFLFDISIDTLNKYRKYRNWKNFYIEDIRKLNPRDVNLYIKYGLNLLIALKETDIFDFDVDTFEVDDFEDYCYLVGPTGTTRRNK